jgi:hypothetical protein
MVKRSPGKTLKLCCLLSRVSSNPAFRSRPMVAGVSRRNGVLPLKAFERSELYVQGSTGS